MWGFVLRAPLVYRGQLAIGLKRGDPVNTDPGDLLFAHRYPSSVIKQELEQMKDDVLDATVGA